MSCSPRTPSSASPPSARHDSWSPPHARRVRPRCRRSACPPRRPVTPTRRGSSTSPVRRALQG
ncbi:hypothetical protein VV02_20700 [Luteipulveratus mongoliensis]|uniref:Uncharacterized protein n=1 Tax=Luteipulveratus mongoliensis TaxID=571913 RepID=A0A0K1JLW4_9MICO|nr:hypothetical protein VV02_20700 [Luteipulveratus mongoliensis]